MLSLEIIHIHQSSIFHQLPLRLNFNHNPDIKHRYSPLPFSKSIGAYSHLIHSFPIYIYISYSFCMSLIFYLLSLHFMFWILVHASMSFIFLFLNILEYLYIYIFVVSQYFGILQLISNLCGIAKKNSAVCTY